MAESKENKVAVAVPYDRQFTNNETMLIGAGDRRVVVKRGETVELEEPLAEALRMRIAFERRMIAGKKKQKKAGETEKKE